MTNAVNISAAASYVNSNGVNSISTTSGALTVAGGVGITGNTYIGGTINGAGTGLTGTASSLSIGGNAGTATALQTARNINGVSFNGSANITITANTTNALTIGTGLSGTSFNGGAAVTIALASGYGDTLNPYASKTKGTVLAAPETANGVPTFRNLVLTDMPGAWIKKAVDAATTTALTINTAQTTIDGVTLSATSRVLVKNQAAPAENGIYTNLTTTTWTRADDADTVSKIAGAFVNVDAGTVNGGKAFDTDFKLTDTLGTTAMTWYMNIDTGMALTSGSTVVDGYIRYAGTTATAGQFDGGTTTPTGTTRLNYGGYFYPTYVNLTGSADTATAATHYFVETGSDGFIRPKTLASATAELVTTASVNAAAATTVGTITSGIWNAGAVSSTGLLTSTASGNQVLLKNGVTSDPTVIHRADGSNYYILLSAAGTTPSGTWNNLRPLTISQTTGLLTSANGQSFSGGLSTSGQITSTVAVGTAPFVVTSTTKVTNLNADFVDGASVGTSWTDVTGNTIPIRHAAGYLYSNYFNTPADITAVAPSHVAIQTGSDNYIRWQTLAQFKTNLNVGGGGQFFGSQAVKAIAYNSNTITENVTVSTGNNAISAGPMTISNGFTVTIANGANWIVV